MESGLYKKYIGTPCKQIKKPYVKEGGKSTGNIKDYKLGSDQRRDEYDARGWAHDDSTLVNKNSFNRSLDSWNKMTSQPGHDSNPEMAKKSNEAFKKIENMKTKDKKGKVVSAMSVFIDD